MERSRHRGFQRAPGRVVGVVALTEPATEAACAVAGGLAAALTRLLGEGGRAEQVELLAIPGTVTPSAGRVPVRTGGLSAVLDRPGGGWLVVTGLPPRDLPRQRVLCPATVAVLVVPPRLPAAQAAVRLLDQSASWARRTVLVPQLPAPAMTRAVLHVAGGAAAGVVPLTGPPRPARLRRTAAQLAGIVLTLPAPTWPGQPIPADERELAPCTA